MTYEQLWLEVFKTIMNNEPNDTTITYNTPTHFDVAKATWAGWLATKLLAENLTHINQK